MKSTGIILLLMVVAVAECFAQTVHKAATVNNGVATSQSGSYTLRSTVGETAAGKASSASFSSNAGFGNVVGSINPRLPDLIFTASNVNPASIAPGGDIRLTFTIKNNGDAAIANNIIVKAYLSADTQLDGSDILLPTSFDLGNVLVSNASIVFPASGQDNAITIPSTTDIKAYQLLIVIDPDGDITESKKDNNLVSSAFTVSTGGSSGPPSFGTLTKPDFFSADAKVSIQIINNTVGLNVRMFHRKLSESEFMDNAMTVDGASAYSISLQTGWRDQTGVEFYFSIPGIDSTSKYRLYNPIPDNQAIPNLSFGGQPENYRIFSIPYDLTENSIDDIFQVFGKYDKTKWRLVRYQGGHNVDNKEGITKIERGQAFWFNAIHDTIINIGAGTTVSKDQSPDFSMTLQKGYNQIGDPFTFDISWAEVLASNPGVADKVSQQVLAYNSNNISLDPSDNLKAWGGGFVLADEQVTLAIPVSLNNSGGRVMSKQIANGNPDLDQWLTTINIQQDGVLNSLNGIGMHPNAKASKDIYDIITPPRFIKYVGMSTEHNDFFEPKFSRDVVQTTDSYNWSFTLESDLNSSFAEMGWNKGDLQSATAGLLLYDVSERVLIDMKQSDRYSFNPQRSHNFRFFFGSDPSQIKPDIQEIGQAWPNPTADVAHIPYIVKEKSRVQIDVYDMMGRKINRVVDSDLEAGYHTATWNRTSSDGSVVSPGMYLYRMNGSINVGRIIVN